MEWQIWICIYIHVQPSHSSVHNLYYQECIEEVELYALVYSAERTSHQIATIAMISLVDLLLSMQQ